MPIESSVVLVALKVGGALVTAGRTISALVSGEKNRQFQEQQRIASENFQRERDAINYLRERERDAINYLRERERDAINHLREAELRMKEIDEQHKNALERDTINYHREAELRMKVIDEQHKNALELQQQASDQQRKLKGYDRWCVSTWPLTVDPDLYVNYLKENYPEDMMPLQVIVPATMPQDRFNGIDNPLAVFFNNVYSPRSGAPVFYYNQGWKGAMYGRNGNAQAIELHRILKGLPTLILSLQEVDGQYSANVVFWGIADMVLPENKALFTVSQKDLDLDILRNEADQIIREYREYNIPLPQDKNIQTRLNELQRQNELEKQGNIPEEIIRNILKREFSNQYSIAGKENLISQERNKVLSAMLQIASAAFTDAYYLVTYNIAPRIPELCADNPDFKHPQIMELFKNIFDSLLANPAGDLLNTPLRYALVADAFRQIGFNEYASSYAKTCADILWDLKRNKKATFAPQHYEASRLLENCNVTVKLPKQIEAKPKKKLIAATGFDDKFLSAIPLGNGVTLEMIKVKAGFFMMGSPEYEKERSNDEKLHRVTLTKDYYLGKFPVTQAQWRAVIEINLSYFGDDTRPSYFEGDNRPVEWVSWDDAKEFCNKLNEKYAGKLPKGYKFDLPTEAQWERACRAGTTTAYFWGDSCNGNQANCNGICPYGTDREGSYRGQTSEVGSYAPNAWGFYDMHGNVWEWCRDWYEKKYGDEAIDPIGPSSGSLRVGRGGSWADNARLCRSARRGRSSPGDCNPRFGFRLALVPVQ